MITSYKTTAQNLNNGLTKEMRILNDLNFDYINKIQAKYQRDFSEAKVLDVGIGGGFLAKKIIKSDKTVEYTGIDIDNYLDKDVRGQVRLIRADLNHLPDVQELISSKKGYDYIFMFDVLEHIILFNYLLENIYRILNENGLLIIALPIDINLSTRVKMLLIDSPFTDPFGSVYGHINLFSIRQFQSGFSKIKHLKIVDIKKCGLGYGLFDRRYHLDLIANVIPSLTSRIYVCLQKS